MNAAMVQVPEDYALDYDRAKHFARVLINESRARRDSPANRNYQWSLLNSAERTMRRALGMNALIQRHRYPEWAEHLGMGDGSAVVHRSTGLRGVVHGTMGVYLTLQPGPHAKFWRAAEFDLAPPAAAAPAQLELFA